MPAHADGTAALELQILGPVRLCTAEGALPLKSRKAQALLLWLVLEGETTRPRLCERLWPAQDEPSARRNLRRELARLREAGAADAVVADGDRLRPAPGLACDLLRAEALLASGRADAALALWHGPPLDDLREIGEGDADPTREGGLPGWLNAVRQRAASLHRQVLEASAAAAEQRGDLPAALSAVQRLLGQDNLQERQHREAMRLLAACGQREEALRQFERCRSLLAFELGVEPMPETLALAQTLRAGAAPHSWNDVAPAAAPSTEALVVDAAVQLPPQLPFVGREAELAALQRAWERRQPVLVVGDPGVGKSRLLADFAAAHGTLALARCRPGDHELPLGSFARALRALAGQPPQVAALEPWVVAELTRVLPELGPAPAPLRNAQERLRFEEACTRAWHGLAAGDFDAVLLDDWQWADDASRALVARIVGAGSGAGADECSTRLLLAWRGAPDEPALLACAEALGAEPLPLTELPEPAVHELVRQLSGSPAPQRFARRLLAATGGLPFFIVETLRDLAEREVLRRDGAGRWHTAFDDDTADYRELPLAASVRDAVLARVRRLGSATTRLLEAAALASEPFAAAALAPACALSELEALAALDEAARVHLIAAREGDNGIGGYAWAHDLARQALESTLEPTRRRLLHHRLALAAESRRANAEAARHFEACGEPARAAPHRLAAGDSARDLHSLAEAAAQWRQGLADSPGPADEAALAARLCEAELFRGHYDEAEAEYRRLLPLLDHPGLASEVRIDLQLRAARYLVLAPGKAPQSIELLNAMPLPDAAPLRLRWWTLRMRALTHVGRLDEALADGHQALAASPEGTPERSEVLLTMWQLAIGRGRYREAAEHANAFLAIATRLGDATGRSRGLFARATANIERGVFDTAEADLREAAALGTQLGNTYAARASSYNLAALFATDQSMPAQALAVLHEAWPGLADAPAEGVAVMYRGLVVECHFQLGTWGSMCEHLAPAIAGAIASEDAYTLRSVASSAAEPQALLGQWPSVQPLLRALEDASALTDAPRAADTILGCASAAMIRGELDAVGAWLARIHEAGQLEHARARCRAALLRAELDVLKGTGPQALEGMPADDAPGMNPELRLRALLTRFRAGQLPRERALAALDDPSAHAGVALLLARALGGDVYTRHRQHLADSLADWPEVQRSFLATWN
jgi:DNA-binding SARP family transcriptional activator